VLKKEWLKHEKEKLDVLKLKLSIRAQVKQQDKFLKYLNQKYVWYVGDNEKLAEVIIGST